MRAFWWFKENSIAGMARPGFNGIRWFDLPFDEALLMGWLGQFSTGTASLGEFQAHLQSYGPRIYKFYQLNEESGGRELQRLENLEALRTTSRRLFERTKIFSNLEIDTEQMHFSVCKTRLETEIEFLRKQKIETIVSLTEKHHGREILDSHFATLHLSIRDLDAPQLEQVIQLAEILKSSGSHKRTAVHCLAGIGRTSTMLIAAHLALGENLHDLKSLIAKQNPAYVLTGPQGAFVEAAAKHFAAK